MLRLIVPTLAAITLTMPLSAALPQGSPAPAFTTQASLAGKALAYSLKDALAKGPVVVYFYPSAYTGGCNIQAHEFSQNIEKFSAAGATVVGVSLDDIETLNEFSADPEYCAGKLTVASDPDGAIAKSYGLKIAEARPGMKNTQGVEIEHGFAERTTFIVMPDGKIAEVVGGMAPKENVEKSLESVQRLALRRKQAGS